MIVKTLQDLTIEEWAAVQTIATDVDGCLLLWPGEDPGRWSLGTTPMINYPLINRLIKWKLDHLRQCKEWIVWSGNGKNHAHWAVGLCNIGQFVNVVCSKPTMIFDDHADWFDPHIMVEVK